LTGVANGGELEGECDAVAEMRNLGPAERLSGIARETVAGRTEAVSRVAEPAGEIECIVEAV
jgi:hypothetical protein